MADAPRAVVVLTGSELVRGDRVDGNGPFLARELTRLGIEPSRLLLVGDDRDELEDAVREAVQADVCVFSGGLGPTHDDRTVETLARVLGRDLIIVEELERRIEAVSRGIAERLGLPYADFVAGVRKQATLPQGGKTLGLAGTAPAVLVEHDRDLRAALELLAELEERAQAEGTEGAEEVRGAGCRCGHGRSVTPPRPPFLLGGNPVRGWAGGIDSPDTSTPFALRRPADRSGSRSRSAGTGGPRPGRRIASDARWS